MTIRNNHGSLGGAMRRLQYYYKGKLTSVNLQGVFDSIPAAAATRRVGRRPRAMMRPQDGGVEIAETLQKQHKRLRSRFSEVSESTMLLAPSRVPHTTVIPTETVAVEGARSTDLNWARREYGLELVEEGRRGKVLLKAPSGNDAVATAFRASRALCEQRNVKAANPNFLRVVQRPGPSSSTTNQQWALDNDGHPGLIGADVHALAAWTITQGIEDVRVAVLDEGVDTLHSYLRDAVVEEADFVDGHTHARPDGDDAHGTACAGIICSQSDRVLGLAPGVLLVAARIAKSDSHGFWIFDDFATADAIDWCWDDAEADVLSNSWGGGPPSDVIANAFERARTRGRQGKGAVVLVAAGNDQAAIDFPGNLDGILTVGASNQWDERKTRSSRDGEDWWGSNYGDTLDLLAPGVNIRTTDIRGRRGYDTTLITGRFNGTSSATPHVAATAALILSIRPTLAENEGRTIINRTADPLATNGTWDRYVGHGRLNAYAALRAARRA